MRTGKSRLAMTCAVGLGGCAGTALRSGVFSVCPALYGVSAATMLVNVVGSFALGLLLESLLFTGEDRGARRMVRLCAGTGLCGGFTTYGTFAFESFGLVHRGMYIEALFYVACMMIMGLASCMLGFAVAERAFRKRDVGA